MLYTYPLSTARFDLLLYPEISIVSFDSCEVRVHQFRPWTLNQELRGSFISSTTTRPCPNMFLTVCVTPFGHALQCGAL